MLSDAIEHVIRGEIERVAPLSNSVYSYDPETGCMDFDGTFRPVEMATAIVSMLRDLNYIY